MRVIRGAWERRPRSRRGQLLFGGVLACLLLTCCAILLPKQPAAAPAPDSRSVPTLAESTATEWRVLDTAIPADTAAPKATKAPPATTTPRPAPTSVPAATKPLPTNTRAPASATNTRPPAPTNTRAPAASPTTRPPTNTAPPPPPPTDTQAPQPTAPPAPGRVAITGIFANGAGSSEADEWVAITNQGGSAVDLAGWRLVDDANHTFPFPGFGIQPGQTCRVYTNEDHPEWCGFNQHSNQGIWNNGGDCAHLYDASGTEVSTRCY